MPRTRSVLFRKLFEFILFVQLLVNSRVLLVHALGTKIQKKITR